MAKIRKNISIEKSVNDAIKAIAEKDKRTESSVVELAVEEYAAKKLAANN